MTLLSSVHTLGQRQNGCHFADDTFTRIFLNENVRTPLKISLKFVPEVRMNDILALVQIMVWRRPGDKTLSEPMMDKLLMHICIDRPQWVNAKCFAAISFLKHMKKLTCWPMGKVTCIYTNIATGCILWLIAGMISLICNDICPTGAHFSNMD